MSNVLSKEEYQSFLPLTPVSRVVYDPVLLCEVDYTFLSDIVDQNTIITIWKVLKTDILILKSLSLSPTKRQYSLSVYSYWHYTSTQVPLLVRAECVRQRNEVVIKLGIIFSSLWADLVSDWLMTSKASLLIGCWELTHIGPS